jgi:NAD(P)-dependent dehydrogenase (short-subunit alcohol dehydrogenase family)
VADEGCDLLLVARNKVALDEAAGSSRSAAAGQRAVIATDLQSEKSRARRGRAIRGPTSSPRPPFGRAGKPEEIAYAVAFLASPLSDYASGAIVAIDGGSG